jgi:dTMP kinase
MFIIIDGIDGSGKSTVVSVWKKYLSDQGNAIFDLKNYIKENNHYPESHEFSGYDFIFSAEPTYTGIGKVLREELISSSNFYPPKAIAEAFSLDRLVLYTKVIIPLLKDGKLVIQDRGVSSSLAYQPLTHPDVTTDFVAHLPGNNLALENRPDYLIFVDCDAKTSFERLDQRADKQDNAIFERLEFLEKLTARYTNENYQKLFTDRGTKILHLNGNEKIDIMKEQAIDLLKTILK